MSRSRLVFPLVVVLAGAAAAMFLGLQIASGRPAPPPRADPPPGRAFLGVQLDWSRDTPSTYGARLGAAPVMYGEYIDFPLSPDDTAQITAHVDEVAAAGGQYMLTLMPSDGLASVSEANVAELARAVRGWTRKAPIFIRFGHEMNGSWYAWGQQPRAYRAAFRRVAEAMHAIRPAAVMVWAPNDGGSYPFPGWPNSARPGTPAFAELDTDGDGRLSMGDDPYAPYYPGDAHVDWVGLTLYHFGYRWPWTENEVPEPGVFAEKLTGTYLGNGGDHRALPDFYRQYAAARGKPLVIAETSALYTPESAGASDFAIKQAWWTQVFDPSLTTRFPLLRGVLWFEHDKFEYGAQRRIEWAVTRKGTLRAAYRRALPDWIVLAD